jgi:hypothetical protein
MKTLDFSRSFFTFRIDIERRPPRTVSHKPPYIQIECRCHIRDKPSGREETLLLGASCKTERVGVQRDIWTEPNADFAPIFSDTAFLNIKTYARAGTQVALYPPSLGAQSDRQTGLLGDAFESVERHLAECDGQVLSSPGEIVAATLANRPLVARTRLENDRYVATMDYPIKTMNANERDMIYQTDTGPVLLPDLSVEPDGLLPRCELAFAAFNGPDWIEFLVRVPTPIDDTVQVQHYSKTVRMDAANQVLALAQPGS